MATKKTKKTESEEKVIKRITLKPEQRKELLVLNELRDKVAKLAKEVILKGIAELVGDSNSPSFELCMLKREAEVAELNWRLAKTQFYWKIEQANPKYAANEMRFAEDEKAIEVLA